MSVSLRKRGLYDFAGASARIGTITEEALRTAKSLDLAENHLTTLQKPFQLSTFPTPLSKVDARAQQQAKASPSTRSRESDYHTEGDRSALTGICNLLYLSVAHNTLRSLAGVGVAAHTLTVLIAPHNQLESAVGLELCAQLRYVDLRHNRLRSLNGLPVAAAVPAGFATLAKSTLQRQPNDSLRGQVACREGGLIKRTSKKGQEGPSQDQEVIRPPLEPDAADLVDGGVVLLLSHNRLKGRALSALSTAPEQTEKTEYQQTAPPRWVSFLSVLDLSANPLEEVGDAERVLRAPHLAQLVEVNLSYVPFLLNGSLASTLLSAAEEGTLEWPVPPPSTIRVELFPHVSADTKEKNMTVSLSKADEAAVREESSQREKRLCRLASACATALWSPDISHSEANSAPEGTPAPQQVKEARVIKLFGAAPTMEFVLETLSMPATASSPSKSHVHTPPRSTHSTSTAEKASTTVLITPPPMWTSPEKVRMTHHTATSEVQDTSPSVPPSVARTAPRHRDALNSSPHSAARLYKAGQTEQSALRKEVSVAERSNLHDDANAAANYSLSSDCGSAGLLHTSTWSANEHDSTVGYMIFKGRHHHSHTDSALLVSRGARTTHQRTSLDDSKRDVSCVHTAPPLANVDAEGELGTMSSIPDDQTLPSSADSPSLRPSTEARRTARATPNNELAVSEIPCSVQVSVLLSENQALRRRNAELESRFREQKQTLTQHKISIDALQEELRSAYHADDASKEAVRKDKAEIKRLRQRVAALEERLAKAHGTMSASRAALGKS